VASSKRKIQSLFIVSNVLEFEMKNEASGYFRVFDEMVYFGNKKKYQEYLDMVKETTGHTLQYFEDLTSIDKTFD
jgi:hypothetical protein